MHSTAGSTHTCSSSSLWTARDAYKEIRDVSGAVQQQRPGSPLLTRHCFNSRKLHSGPLRESCPASSSQEHSRQKKEHKASNPDDKRKQEQICNSQESWLRATQPQRCPWISMGGQFLVFHAIPASYHHSLLTSLSNTAIGSCTCLQFSCFNSCIWALKDSFSFCTSCWKKKGNIY